MTPGLTLHTPRLEMIAATLDHLEAELLGPGHLDPLLDARVPGDWPPGEYDRDAILFFRDRLAEGGAACVGWYGWYAVAAGDGGERVLVANAGYMGPPEDGAVEIGYSVLPGARGAGYATEMVTALLERAFGEPSVEEVVAHAAQGNEASARVLLRCGFSPAGPGAEPGTDRFTKKRPGA